MEGSPGEDDDIRLIAAVLGRKPRSVTLLGRGTDHTAYEVDGQLVARVATRLDGKTVSAVAREEQVLRMVAGISTVPVPEVVASAPDAGVLVVRKVAGTSLLDEPCPEPARLVSQLASFLTRLHDRPAAELAGAVPTDEYPITSYLTDAADTLPRIAAALAADQRRLVEAFLDAPTPAEPIRLVLAHNDLGAEHLFADTDRCTLTGVIDWSDAAVSDPARDIGRLYRDLGPATARSVVERLPRCQDLIADQEELLHRAAFHARCALVEDIDHGLTTGDRRYVDAALAHLARTFDDDHLQRRR